MSGIIWRNLEKSPKCIFSANIGCYMTLRKQRLQCNFFLHFSLQACTEGFLRRRNFQMINEWCSVLVQLASQLLCMEMGLLRLATDLNKRSNWITCLKHVHSRILNSSFFFQDDEKDRKKCDRRIEHVTLNGIFFHILLLPSWKTTFQKPGIN